MVRSFNLRGPLVLCLFIAVFYVADAQQIPLPQPAGYISSNGPGDPLIFLNDAVVSGNYLYGVSSQNNEFSVVDISNPREPEVVATLYDGDGGITLKGPRALYVSGNLAYIVSDNMLTAQLQSLSLEIINISDPTNPIHVGTLIDENGDYPYNVAGPYLYRASDIVVSGNYAYISIHYGLEIVDVSDPANPVHKSNLYSFPSATPPTPPDMYFEFVSSVELQGNYAYLLGRLGNDYGFMSVDITDPADPTMVGFLPHGTISAGPILTNPAGMEVVGDYAYVISLNNAMEILDISDPAAPAHLAFVKQNNPTGTQLDVPVDIDVAGDFAYITSQGIGAIEIVDISDPAAPEHAAVVLSGDNGQPPYISGGTIDIVGNYAYVGSIGLQVLSIFTPGPPAVQLGLTLQVGEIEKSTSFKARWKEIDGLTYTLEVSTDDFATRISGYDNVAVTGTFAQGGQQDDKETLVLGLTPNTTYKFRMKAVNANGPSAPSAPITVTTAPGAPVVTAATDIEDEDAKLNWEPVAGATNYFIYLYGGAGPTTIFDGYPAGNVTSFDVGGILSPATNYSYSVRAGNVNGESPSSGSSHFTTTPTYTTFLPASSVTETSFVANWNDDPADITGFFLDVTALPDFTVMLPGYDNLDVGDVTSRLVNTGLTAGTTYYYRVRTANASGSSPNSSTPISVTTAPLPPVLGSATEITTTSFKANWSAAVGATGYRIDVSTNDGFTSFVPLYNDKAVAVSPTNVTVSGLVAGTTYYYRVRAVNAGTSGTSGVTEVVTIPVAPVATAASGVTETTFTANWATVQSATQYFVDVSTDNFATLMVGFDNLAVASSSVGVTGLSVNTIYSYRVRAANASGTSENSNTINVLTAPLAPVAIAASEMEHNRATLNWQSVSGATKYFIYLYDNGNLASPNSAFNGYDVGNVTSFEVNGSSISSAANYKFRVKSSNGAQSSFSNGIDFTTKPTYTTFLAATSITATSFTANWTDDPGVVTGYFLDVATDAAFTQMLTDYDNLDVGDVTSTPVNTGLAAGTTYYYRVRTANASGTSPNSPSPASVTLIPPAPALNSAIAITSTGFTASWNPAPGATGYRIDVSTNDAFTSFVPLYNDKAVASSPTEVAVTGLVAGTTYYYRVRATNSGGTSGTAGVTEVVTVPPAPVAAAASGIGETSFTANWAAVASATDYIVDLSLSATFDELSHPVVVGLTASITGASANTTYYYRVRAVNASGTSANSNTISVVTAPTAPVATAATGINHNSATLNWQSVPGATKYFIYVYDQGNLGIPNSAFNRFDVGNATSFEVTGSSILPAANYKFRVKADNGAESPFSNAIDFTTKPTYTTFLPATSVTTSSFIAHWNDDPAIVTGYFLDVATDPTFTQLLTDYDNLDVGDVTSKLVNIGLTAGTTYYYRVRTANASGSSPNSPSAITVVTTPPAPTLNDATAITATSFTASWNAASGATGYRIDVSTNEGFTSFVPLHNDKAVPASPTSLEVTALVAGTTYFYRVRAENSGGTSGTQGITELITLPVAPSATSASLVGQTFFTANWATVLSATHYFIDLSTDPSFGSFVAGFNNFEVNGSTAGITGLAASTTYHYRVRAANASGSSSNSNTITVLTAPTAPVATEAQSFTQTSFVATWNAVSSATGYKVDVSTQSNFPSFVPGFEGATSTTTSLNVSGLTPGNTYHYRVRATNGSGSSDNSNVISQITIPATPPVVAADPVGQTSFTAKWSAVTGADEYLVDVLVGGIVLVGYENVSVIGGNSLVVDEGVVAGTDYSYVVRASNAAGESPPSDARPVLTRPPTPEGLPAAISGTVSFTAKWKESRSATKYTVVVATDELFNNIVPGYNSFDVNGGSTLQLSVTVNAPTTGAIYYYKVNASNGSGSSPFSEPILVNTPATSFQSILLPTGGTTESYMIISIPEGTTASTTLASESFLKSWRVMHYENDATGNVDFPTVSQMEAGKGYWVNSSLEEAPAITLGGQTLPVDQTLTLQPGWNQIGNPFNFNISWQDVLAKNNTVTTVGDLYTYNVPNPIKDFVIYDGLMGFGGGFVNNTSTSNVILNIPADVERFTARKIGAGRFAISGRDIAANEWFLPITLEAGAKVNNLGGIGMHPEANKSIDRFDAIALPRFFNRPSLTSLHPEFFQPRFMKDIVPTSDSHSWTLEISTQDEQSDARLTWDNKGWGDAVLYLVDEAAGVVLDMSKSDRYAFDTRKTRSVTFIFGKGTTMAPDITALGQPFPNPSVDRVTFPFIAREDENFSIHIVDLTGRTVGSMTIEGAQAGYNEAIWNTLDGGNLPPGIYLYQFSSSTGVFKSGRIVLK